MSLYADFLKEKTDDLIIENENGFVTYRYVEKDTVVYIVNIYIVPEHRKTKLASNLADQVVKEAKEKGVTKLWGSVVPSVKGSTINLQVLIGYGMKLDSSAENFILFKKDI